MPPLPPADAAWAETAFRNICESLPPAGSTGGGGATAAGGGDRGGGRTADGGGDRLRRGDGAARRGAPSADTSAGGFQSGVIASLKPMCRWFWWAASVK